MEKSAGSHCVSSWQLRQLIGWRGLMCLGVLGTPVVSFTGRVKASYRLVRNRHGESGIPSNFASE